MGKSWNAIPALHYSSHTTWRPAIFHLVTRFLFSTCAPLTSCEDSSSIDSIWLELSKLTLERSLGYWDARCLKFCFTYQWGTWPGPRSFEHILPKNESSPSWNKIIVEQAYPPRTQVAWSILITPWATPAHQNLVALQKVLPNWPSLGLRDPANSAASFISNSPPWLPGLLKDALPSERSLPWSFL